MFRRLSEQDFYQVLEVAYDASPEEIQSAYEDAREIYSHEALVSVSILTEPERRKTYERIAEAYQTLIAEESRRLYDEALGIPRRNPIRTRITVERREAPLILTSSLNPLDTESLDEAEGTLPESGNRSAGPSAASRATAKPASARVDRGGHRRVPAPCAGSSRSRSQHHLRGDQDRLFHAGVHRNREARPAPRADLPQELHSPDRSLPRSRRGKGRAHLPLSHPPSPNPGVSLI